MAAKKRIVEKKILLRAFKSTRVKNLMELEAKLVYDADTKALDALCYLTIFEGFVRRDADKVINLQFSLPTLIEMTFEMENLTREGVEESPFKNYTQSSVPKWVTLGKRDDTYFINFERKEASGRKVSMSFGRMEFLAVAKVIERAVDSVYDEYDKAFRKKQERSTHGKK